MLKVKIYQTDKNISRDSFVKSLVVNEFTDDEGIGFKIINDNDDDFRFQFIEKVLTLQQIETVDGESSEVEIVSFIKTNFLIRFNSLNALIILNPPRSVGYSYQMVRELLLKSYNLVPITFNLKELLSDFSQNNKLKVKSLSLSNIQCNINTIAKTTLVSTKCLFSYYIDNYSKTQAKMDTTKVLLDDMEMEIFATGRIKLAEKSLLSFLLLVENSKTKNWFIS